MTFTDTEVITDPDELMPDGIPCGGNLYPTKRECPHNASAAMVSYRCCDGSAGPPSFKCLACYREWYAASTDRATCKSCGMIKPRDEWYREI